jgi:hypothetical protein
MIGHTPEQVHDITLCRRYIAFCIVSVIIAAVALVALRDFDETEAALLRAVFFVCLIAQTTLATLFMRRLIILRREVNRALAQESVDRLRRAINDVRAQSTTGSTP